VTPSGNVNVQQANTNEELSWVSSQHTRVIQGTYGRYGYTDDGEGTTTDTREAGASLGLERDFVHDTVSINAAVAYLQLQRLAPVGALLGSRIDHQINPRATVLWRHDFDKSWSASADGGVVFVNPVGIDPYNLMEPRNGVTFGIFGGQVAYSEPWGRATLSARRDVAPNLYLAENTIDDTVNLQLALPLTLLDETRHNPKFVLLASTGLEHTQLIDAELGTNQGDFKVAHFDAPVGYTPRPGQTYGVRYEVVYQTGDPTAQMAITSFYRNTLYFTFSLRYPDRVIGELPKKQPSLRSDRKDLVPFGGYDVIDGFDNDRDSTGGSDSSPSD